MHLLRAFFRHHRGIALLLAVAALWIKALMPAGYMIGPNSSTLTIQLCEGGSQTVLLPGKADPAGHQAKADCPYASLGMQSLGGVDPLLLLVAIAFIITLGFAPVGFVAPKAPLHLRPPLRGPPTTL